MRSPSNFTTFSNKGVLGLLHSRPSGKLCYIVVGNWLRLGHSWFLLTPWRDLLGYEKIMVCQFFFTRKPGSLWTNNSIFSVEHWILQRKLAQNLVLFTRRHPVFCWLLTNTASHFQLNKIFSYVKQRTSEGNNRFTPHSSVRHFPAQCMNPQQLFAMKKTTYLLLCVRNPKS